MRKHKRQLESDRKQKISVREASHLKLFIPEHGKFPLLGLGPAPGMWRLFLAASLSLRLGKRLHQGREASRSWSTGLRTVDRLWARNAAEDAMQTACHERLCPSLTSKLGARSSSCRWRKLVNSEGSKAQATSQSILLPSVQMVSEASQKQTITPH